ANLLKGSPKITPGRAKALANAAIREACEETGLCLGRKADKATKLEGPWKPFADAGLLPDPSGLFLIARAITRPGRVRRFDTRFFRADASAIAHRVEGVVHADAELVELVWVEIGSKPLADAHAMTKNVLGELDRRLATGPLRHDAPVPFFHFYGGRSHRAVLRAQGPCSVHVIASEAKQSSLLRRSKEAGLLRRFAPRNEGENLPGSPTKLQNPSPRAWIARLKVRPYLFPNNNQNGMGQWQSVNSSSA